MRLDLHVHSTASDGVCSPDEVVERAAAGGLDVIALADHDTTAGVASAKRAARDRPVEVIAAVELSSTYRGEDVHVLAYFLDIESPALAAQRRRGFDRRAARMREMRERLAAQGITVTSRQVDAQRASGDVAAARPHLARALVAAGHAVSVPDAFARLIGDGCPAYVPTEVSTPEEVIGVALAAGGIPVWAHPPAALLEKLLPPMLDAGLKGLEVYRPPGRSASPAKLREIAQAEGLLVTGGSDWHGPAAGSELGDFFVTGDQVASFLEAGGA